MFRASALRTGPFNFQQQAGLRPTIINGFVALLLARALASLRVLTLLRLRIQEAV